MLLSLKLTRKQFDTNLKRNFLELNNEFTDGKIQKAILFPYPGTLELIDERYWDEIFLILEENNIQTYTNIINENQKEIKGSKRLELKLDEIIRYADKNTIIIARRNGLNDVFALNNCKQLLIYDNSKKNELETYSIFDLYCRLNRNDSLSELCVEKFYDKKSLENIKLNLIKLIN